ncbi:MAG: hypothetical protein ACRD06_02570 [Terriglobia bacterium]
MNIGIKLLSGWKFKRYSYVLAPGILATNGFHCLLLEFRDQNLFGFTVNNQLFCVTQGLFLREKERKTDDDG